MSDYLCEELIVEIFGRLPLKSLLRFTSLCKSLRSCIASSHFIRMHASRSPKRLIIAHHLINKNTEKYDYEIFRTLHPVDDLSMCPIRYCVKFPTRTTFIASSCNGIICLHDIQKGMIILWNPSIRRQLTLSDYSRRFPYRIVIGFGFDPITYDNKIVTIRKYGENIQNSFIYSMKTGDWRPISTPMPFYSYVLSSACFVNGVLHWVVFTNSKDVDPWCILTFDLSTHVFGMIAFPKPSWRCHKLTIIQDSLAVISKDRNDSCICVRRDDSWSVIFKSETDQYREGVRNVVELTKDGDFLFDTYSDEFQVYNSKREARSRVVGFNDACVMVDMDIYVESLQLLDMGTVCKVNRPSFSIEKKRNGSLLDHSTESQTMIEYSEIDKNHCLS